MLRLKLNPVSKSDLWCAQDEQRLGLVRQIHALMHISYLGFSNIFRNKDDYSLDEID